MRILFIDTETTGLDPVADDIVEVAGVLVDDDQELGLISLLARPTRPMDPAAVAIHGLSELALRNAAPIGDGVTLLAGMWNRADAIAAYNAPFDRAFLARADIARQLQPRPWIDVLERARSKWPDARSHRLQDLTRTLGLATPDRPHRALDDARLAFRLWRATHEKQTDDGQPLAPATAAEPRLPEVPLVGPLALFR